MKIKLSYIYALWELGTFLYEMRKRNANSVKFEFQESIGKFNIYIDDSAFKTVDGKIGWQIIRTLYSTVTKKSQDTFDKDISFTDNAEIKSDELNTSFNLRILPLTKGRCLSYSYSKKKGDIYEASIKVKSNDFKNVFSEKLSELNSKLSAGVDIFFTDSHGVEFSVDNLFLKSGDIKLCLISSDGKEFITKFSVDFLNSKKAVNAFFEQFKDADKKELHEILINKDKNLDIKKVKVEDLSWD